jgi:hypothetical protein
MTLACCGHARQSFSGEPQRRVRFSRAWRRVINQSSELSGVAMKPSSVVAV